jgi:RNA polymerase sigma factor (sigma-70 family)
MTTVAANSSVKNVNLHHDLIIGCRMGDQKAQFQIYKLYYRAMYNTSLRIVNNPEEAEDIMQESFLTAFEEINKYSGTVSFGAWLKSIVQNRSIDSLRKSRKLSFEDLETVSDMEDNCRVNQFLNEETDQTMVRILDTIKHLPEKCRNIFSLYFLEGYDHEEISEILSISESTSRSQVSRARFRFITEFKSRY